MRAVIVRPRRSPARSIGPAADRAREATPTAPPIPAESLRDAVRRARAPPRPYRPRRLLVRWIVPGIVAVALETVRTPCGRGDHANRGYHGAAPQPVNPSSGTPAPTIATRLGVAPLSARILPSRAAGRGIEGRFPLPGPPDIREIDVELVCVQIEVQFRNALEPIATSGPVRRRPHHKPRSRRATRRLVPVRSPPASAFRRSNLTPTMSIFPLRTANPPCSVQAP